jgi:hypothetical protein
VKLRESIFDEGQLDFVVVDVDAGVDEVEEEKLNTTGQQTNYQLKRFRNQ